jgi:putative flavoprotein involved in K+ transport
MKPLAAVVIGGGHNGLAMSHRLTAAGLDHVVVERGERAGTSWRTQRWDSLRLLTPAWMTRLPGRPYAGQDARAYLPARQVAELLEDYGVAAPMVTGTPVTSVRPDHVGFQVETPDRGWKARTVVLATGPTVPVVPALARQLPAGVESLSALDYRNPDQLPETGVLVVGASASGVQIADELRRSGRPVTLAVGEHVRLPRTYRGEDVFTWLEALCVLDQRWDELPDLERVRNLPSPQLAGTGHDLDLNRLIDNGVRLVGKLVAVRDGVAQFSGSLPNTVALPDLKLGRFLDSVDELLGGGGERPEPTRLGPTPLALDLRASGIGAVVWATGARPDHSWLELPVLDRRGRIRHDGGVVDWPGLYVLGLSAMRTRRSTYIDGARADTRELTDHLLGHLAGRAHDPHEKEAS